MRRLKELSRSEGVTLFMMLLAGFQVLLSVCGAGRRSGRDADGESTGGGGRADRVFREHAGAADGDERRPEFQGVLGRVREVALERMQHQDVPFEKLVEELQPERDLSRTPLFQVMFVLQNTARWELELRGIAR